MEKNVFSSYQIEMVKSLSSYAAIAINNALKSMELEKLNKELLFLSEHDSMTKINNRGKFDSYLNDVWNKSLSEKSSISLILLDIDYFKEYNDNYGHVAGDKCIFNVAKFLHKLTNGKYFLARYGGDEFTIVLPNCLLEEAVSFGKIINREIEALGIKHEFSNISNILTLSIGVSTIIPNSDTAINEFIRKTDAALYFAKKNGRNNVSVQH
jgi:diguanylate cyclase (GGDEF)-like protein